MNRTFPITYSFCTRRLLCWKRERVEEAIAIATRRDSDSVVSGSYDKGHYWVEVEGGWERLYPKNR